MSSMRYLQGIVFLLSILFLIGCQPSHMIEEDTQVNTKVVHMTVNDETLSEDDSFALIEPVWWVGDIYGSVNDYEESLAQFSTPQRYLFAMHWYMSEVNNGGHDQFYFNSTGIVWPDALSGFEAIGLDEAVNIIQETIARLGNQPSRDRYERQDQLDRSSADFTDLDDRFYELQNRVDMNQLMMDYAREHASSFYFDGDVEVLDF